MSAATSRMDRRAFLALGGGSALALGHAGAGLRLPRPLRLMEGRAFATEWSIAVPDSVDIERLRAPIDEMLAAIDRQMSPWRADSDVTRFNRASAGTMKMPAELVGVTSAALALAGTSGGEFDPTVGPLVSRWGFGPIKGDDATDWRDIGVEGDAVSKAHDGLTLDLCGIAKGYALDRMADIVRGAGHEDFLIDLGGELRAGGSIRPAGTGMWRSRTRARASTAPSRCSTSAAWPSPPRAAAPTATRSADGATATSSIRRRASRPTAISSSVSVIAPTP